MTTEELHLICMIKSGLDAMQSAALSTKGSISIGFDCIGLLRELMESLFIRYDEEFTGEATRECWMIYYLLEDVVKRLPQNETDWIDVAVGQLP